MIDRSSWLFSGISLQTHMQYKQRVTDQACQSRFRLSRFYSNAIQNGRRKQRVNCPLSQLRLSYARPQDVEMKLPRMVNITLGRSIVNLSKRICVDHADLLLP